GAETLAELERVVEDERLVVEEVHHDREIVRRREPRALAAARVEVAVAGVQRQREQALRAPFERVLAAVGGLDRRAAVAREDVDHFFIQMALGFGLFTWP